MSTVSSEMSRRYKKREAAGDVMSLSYHTIAHRVHGFRARFHQWRLAGADSAMIRHLGHDTNDLDLALIHDTDTAGQTTMASDISSGRGDGNSPLLNALEKQLRRSWSYDESVLARVTSKTKINEARARLRRTDSTSSGSS